MSIDFEKFYILLMIFIIPNQHYEYLYAELLIKCKMCQIYPINQKNIFIILFIIFELYGIMIITIKTEEIGLKKFLSDFRLCALGTERKGNKK